MSDEVSELDELRRLDSEAVARIHNRYFPEIFRYVRYRSGDEIIAEDIAGETFTRLLEALVAGQGPTISLRGWLVGTASHLVNDYLRKEYTHPTETLSEEHEFSVDGLNPYHHAVKSEQRQTVRAAMARLSPEQQLVISLRFGGGYSLEETANFMKKKPNAIKALQFRAFTNLRRLLTPQDIIES
jgi:RNA polymerase sigma-70 factor (ECF subfamily)